jgi:hypothetical protein
LKNLNRPGKAKSIATDDRGKAYVINESGYIFSSHGSDVEDYWDQVQGIAHKLVLKEYKLHMLAK